MKQKEIFLATEGDAWLRRNAAAQRVRTLPDEDDLLLQVLALPGRAAGGDLLEIGFGDASRLAWLGDHTAFRCHGVEPSGEAVAQAQASGAKVDARQGTADHLPFADHSMDVVVFGFCLYLCDRVDLFRIAAEADRVLRNPGWLLIQDFFSPVPVQRPYHHRAGVFSSKMDYRSLFSWHPSYTCYFHTVRHHRSRLVTDEPQEWVATSVLRKHPADASRL